MEIDPCYSEQCTDDYVNNFYYFDSNFTIKLITKIIYAHSTQRCVPDEEHWLTDCNSCVACLDCTTVQLLYSCTAGIWFVATGN